MKTRTLFSLAILLSMTLLSSCYVDLELGEAYVDVMHVEEYETKDVIYQEFDNGVLVYEEAVYDAWLEIELWNSGGSTARNVQVEIEVMDHHGSQVTVIHTKNLSPHESVNLSFNTGYAFTNDYINYKVYVYWD